MLVNVTFHPVTPNPLAFHVNGHDDMPVPMIGPVALTVPKLPTAALTLLLTFRLFRMLTLLPTMTFPVAVRLLALNEPPSTTGFVWPLATALLFGMKFGA